MERAENFTAPPGRAAAQPEGSCGPQVERSDGNAYLYVLIVMCFYGVFLCAIMLSYFRSKRRENKRVNVFTRLVHEEEQREWGALPKMQSPTMPVPAPAATSGPRSLHLPFCGAHGNHLAHLHCEDAPLSPLACASCTEQSSVSSLCSSADTRLAIEEESDSGTAEGPEENPRGGSETSGDDTG